MSKVEKLAQQLFDGTKGRIAESIGNIVPDLKAELQRLGTQGTMELASALFAGGNSFVPYGPGQYTPSHPGHEHGAGQEQGPGHEHGQERGMEMER